MTIAEQGALNRPAGTRAWRRRATSLAFPVGALVGLLVVWEGLVAALRIPAWLVAPPTAVWSAFVANPGYIASHTASTGVAALAGFTMALAVAVFLAIVIAYSRLLERLLYPYLVITQVVPIIAIAPLLAIWFGFGFAPKVIVSFLIAFFPIVINLVLGFRSPDRNILMLMRSMNAREVDTFRKVRVPSALPLLFAACRIAAPASVIGAIVAEFVGSDSGVGYVILYAKGYLRTDMIFLAIVASSILGIAFFAFVVLLESRFVSWHESRG